MSGDVDIELHELQLVANGRYIENNVPGHWPTGVELETGGGVGIVVLTGVVCESDEQKQIGLSRLSGVLAGHCNQRGQTALLSVYGVGRESHRVDDFDFG